MLTILSQQPFVKFLLLSQSVAQYSAEQGQLPQPDFQPYIFWAYGLACLLLFVFTLWTLTETRRLGKHLRYLKERFEHARPEKDRESDEHDGM